MHEQFIKNAEAFEDLAKRASRLGNFLNVEQLFLDAQIYARPVNEALIRAAGQLHLDSEGFIGEDTTPTDVFFETYRRAAFTANLHSFGSLIADDYAQQRLALEHLERLVAAGEIEGSKGNVINLFGSN